MSEKKAKKEKIIGIDLGTTNSAAAVILGGKPTIIPAEEGMTPYGKAVPSYVAFTKDGQVLVGEPARRQAIKNPEGTVYGIKRKMGLDYKVKIYGKEYTPQEISAFILRKIKKDAEAFLGEPVNDAVITVPAYFNDNQRQATKDAGKIAGFNVRRLVNEPTAAALAYGIDKEEKENLNILVFDFGSGTLDCTIMEYGEGVFNVKSTSGDTNLGGTDMDEALMNYCLEEFKKEEGIDLRNDKSAKIPPWMAAPIATHSIGSIPPSGGTFVISSTNFLTIGILVGPPTSITLSTLSIFASFIACSTGFLHLSTIGSTSDSNLDLVIFIIRCSAIGCYSALFRYRNPWRSIYKIN